MKKGTNSESRTIHQHKGKNIYGHSENRYYVNRFNDIYHGKIMFTTLSAAQEYIDKHSTL